MKKIAAIEGNEFFKESAAELKSTGEFNVYNWFLISLNDVTSQILIPAFAVR
ncbi:MAG: hypothetical protein IPN88_10740 [Bacteroidetes bacterium]|nr:hypothetical protein [Bacteroidota bacterium]